MAKKKVAPKENEIGEFFNALADLAAEKGIDQDVFVAKIKLAIEKIFGVQVASVNTTTCKGKWKRMGRHAGYIPVECGIAIGATGIAIPEIPFDKEKLIKNLKNI